MSPIYPNVDKLEKVREAKPQSTVQIKPICGTSEYENLNYFRSTIASKRR